MFFGGIEMENWAKMVYSSLFVQTNTYTKPSRETLHQPILHQCSILIHPENVTKPLTSAGGIDMENCREMT